MKFTNSFSFILLLISYFFFTGIMKSQNLQGHSGLFLIPSANLFDDGTVITGANFIRREVVSFGAYSEDAFSPYLTLTFLPFAEFNVRVTRLIHSKSSTQGIGDRTVSLRIKLINENDYLPAILIGFHDLAAVYGGPEAVHNNALYIVASKNVTINHWFTTIGLNIGYGTDKVKARTHQFVGFWGGISFLFLNKIELMAEYDGKYSNGGIRIKLFDNIKLLGGFLRYKHFSGGAAFSWVL